MKLFTFTGRTPSEALKKAKLDPNYDSMFHINTQQIQQKSFTKEPLYELVMGLESSSIDVTYGKRGELKGGEQRVDEQKPLAKKSADVLFDISNAAKHISQIHNTKEPMDSSFVPQLDTKELKEIKDEISKLSDKVKIIQSMFWDEKAPQVQIPPEFAEIYKLAYESGMDRAHLDSVMSITLEHMPQNMRQNSTTIKKYFQTILRKMVGVRLDEPLGFGQKRVVMLVGPTGVGKTTSIAKLAARYSYLMERKYKVGLVVLDTYRIGALEQLMQYARMMKLSIETVVDPPEFASALESLKYCDYILIDTMGSSPYDQKKLRNIYECLNARELSYDVDVTLVLPSSIKYEDLLLTYESFSFLGVDSLMFTKLDETRAFGNIFSLAYEVKKPISFFSVGQEVPEDLVPARGEFLVDCLLDGFDRSRA